MIKGVYIHFKPIIEDSMNSIKVLDKIFNRIAEANIDFILPLTKDTRSNSSYPSKYIPGRIYKNINLLKNVCRIGHEYGLKIYPWLCIFSEGGEKPSSILKPDWRFIPRDGVSKGYVCPTSIDAKEYELNIVREIINNYDVDGISLDYIRTPGGPCYCKRCREKFREKYGIDPVKISFPSEAWYLWEEFNRENITSFVKNVHEVLSERGLKLSAYVWTSISRYIVAQDWPKWVRSGYIDFIIPTGYVYSIDEFKRLCEDAKIISEGVDTYICIGVKTSHGFIENYRDLRSYISIVRDVGLNGYVFFTLEALLPMLEMIRDYLED